MRKEEWKNRIEGAAREAGTYQPFFDDVIDTLASIMEMRDTAVSQYEEHGSKPVVEHTNKAGYTNIRKNPAMAVITECNQQALAYWRDLGLTAKGYHQLTGKKVEEKQAGDAFTQLLDNII